MDLDSFFISILFDNNKTQDSANKIQGVVDNLKNKIIGAFTAIGSIDFLKNAVESSVNLATKMDNLSYQTNISKESLNGWAEAVKRTGGTTEGFYSSVSSLSEKIRDMQTNFGSAGQLVFARLGVSIKDANGNVRDALDILGELGDKFQSLPKVWQQNLGQQLGLDPATIRLISSGSQSAGQLVQHMKELAQLNNLNTDQNIKFRNSLYDISLVFESIKIQIANALLPLLQDFSDMLLKGLIFLEQHMTLVRLGIVIISALMAGSLVRAIAAVTRAFFMMSAALLTNPFTWWTIGIVAFILLMDDFLRYLEGKSSAFDKFYSAIAGSKFVKGIQFMVHILKEFADTLKYINGFTGRFLGEKGLGLGEVPDWAKPSGTSSTVSTQPGAAIQANRSIQEMIRDTAISMGVDPNIAGTIANIESGFNTVAKNPKSSASGIFGLTNETAQSNGITDLSTKNNAAANIQAGILNISKISKGLTDFFGHAPSGAETYIGEMFGLEGSKRIFRDSNNSPLSQLFNDKVLRSNPQFRNLTTGQLINNANKTFQQKSVTLGDVHINAPNANAGDISNRLSGLMQQQLSGLVTNLDNGVRV